MQDSTIALGPGSATWGRRPRRQLATVAIEARAVPINLGVWC